MPSGRYRHKHLGKHTIRGATKEKTRKLDELKAKRKAKEERARVSLSLLRSAFPDGAVPGSERKAVVA